MRVPSAAINPLKAKLVGTDTRDQASRNAEVFSDETIDNAMSTKAKRIGELRRSLPGHASGVQIASQRKGESSHV